MTLDEYRTWAAPRCKSVPHLADDMPCLVWQGATINRGRDPRAVMKRGARPTQVRRGAWDALHPDTPLGKDATRPSCDCALCVEPTHLRRVTQSEYRSVPKSASGRLNMQIAALASRSKVADRKQVVRIVQASARPASHLAAEIGIGEDTVRNIRAGKWDRAVLGASPWSGLGAR